MSFTNNPYRQMPVATDNVGDFHWACESCGGCSTNGWAESTSIVTIRIDFDRHLRNSHRLDAAIAYMTIRSRPFN